jgi:hypothetical protein
MHAWRDMLPSIWATYRDGYVFTGLDQPTVSVQRMFYPEWWLEQVGYFNPMNLNHDTGAILFASDPAYVSTSASASTGTGTDANTGSSFLSALVPVAGGLLVGLVAGKYLGRTEGRREGYTSIPLDAAL